MLSHLVVSLFNRLGMDLLLFRDCAAADHRMLKWVMVIYYPSEIVNISQEVNPPPHCRDFSVIYQPWLQLLFVTVSMVRLCRDRFEAGNSKDGLPSFLHAPNSWSVSLCKNQ